MSIRETFQQLMEVGFGMPPEPPAFHQPAPAQPPQKVAMNLDKSQQDPIEDQRNNTMPTDPMSVAKAELTNKLNRQQGAYGGSPAKVSPLSYQAGYGDINPPKQANMPLPNLTMNSQ